MDLEDVVGAHLGVCVPELTRTESSERTLRSATGEQAFDGVLLVEAYDGAVLDRCAARVEALVEAAEIGFRFVETELYNFVFMLRHKL